MSLAPGETTSSTTYKARIIGDYILEHLASHKGGKDAAAPLMVAMHGPQGCGKTTLTNEIQRYLQDSQAKARSAVLSLDDLYHKHESLLSLCQSHPNNGLLAGRGLPGTHDLELARTTLDAVINCNQRAVTHIELPVFDKSVFGGEGDRSSSTISIETPIDVFILEGWSRGFQALAQDELCRKYEQARSSLARDPSSPAPTFLSYSLESVQRVNEYLLAASEILYPPFSLLVQICPESYANDRRTSRGVCEAVYARVRALGRRRHSGGESRVIVEREKFGVAVRKGEGSGVCRQFLVKGRAPRIHLASDPTRQSFLRISSRQ